MDRKGRSAVLSTSLPRWLAKECRRPDHHQRQTRARGGRASELLFAREPGKKSRSWRRASGLTGPGATPVTLATPHVVFCSVPPHANAPAVSVTVGVPAAPPPHHNTNDKMRRHLRWTARHSRGLIYTRRNQTKCKRGSFLCRQRHCRTHSINGKQDGICIYDGLLATADPASLLKARAAKRRVPNASKAGRLIHTRRNQTKFKRVSCLCRQLSNTCRSRCWTKATFSAT